MWQPVLTSFGCTPVFLLPDTQSDQPSFCRAHLDVPDAGGISDPSLVSVSFLWYSGNQHCMCQTPEWCHHSLYWETSVWYWSIHWVLWLSLTWLVSLLVSTWPPYHSPVQFFDLDEDLCSPWLLNPLHPAEEHLHHAAATDLHRVDVLFPASQGGW